MTDATDATTKFLDDVASRGHEPLLEKATGTIRLELRQGKRTARWLVAIRKGDVTVSRKNSAADCVIRADSSVVEELLRGRTNAMAAVLRGAVEVEGKPELLVLFQRLFPGPHASRKATATGGARRRS